MMILRNVAAMIVLAAAAACVSGAAAGQQDDTLPLCREAAPGERCVTRTGEIRVRAAARNTAGATGNEVAIESLSSRQLESLAVAGAIGGRWECACSDGEGSCNPVLEEGKLECFAPGTGGCTGTCGLGITVDTTGVGAAQTQGPGR